MESSSHLDADAGRNVDSLERWHAIHDAYVAFFGDEHRPAAVLCADNAQRPVKIESTPHISPNYIQLYGSGYMARAKIEWLEDHPEVPNRDLLLAIMGR